MAEKREVVVDGDGGQTRYWIETEIDPRTFLRQAMNDQFVLIPADSTYTTVGMNSQNGKTRADRYFPASRIISVA